MLFCTRTQITHSTAATLSHTSPSSPHPYYYLSRSDRELLQVSCTRRSCLHFVSSLQWEWTSLCIRIDREIDRFGLGCSEGCHKMKMGRDTYIRVRASKRHIFETCWIRKSKVVTTQIRWYTIWCSDRVGLESDYRQFACLHRGIRLWTFGAMMA